MTHMGLDVTIQRDPSVDRVLEQVAALPRRDATALADGWRALERAGAPLVESDYADDVVTTRFSDDFLRHAARWGIKP